MKRRHWPAALAVLSTVIFGSYLLYTESLVREIRAEAVIHSQIYALIQQGIAAPEEQEVLMALWGLQERVRELGLPMILVNPDGEPSYAENLPFYADLSDPADRARVLEYARRLSRETPPVSDEWAGTIYMGTPRLMSWLRWLPWLQVAGALLILAVAVALVRIGMRAEGERMWAAMARELAHQMGTPLSSLSGWVELLRLSERERVELATTSRIATEIASDVERLERVSRRFELIGKPPAFAPVEAAEILEELDAYMRPRLPRFAAGVELRVWTRRRLPPVRANRVLLVWALENLVKNALDALAGRGGRIQVLALEGSPGRVRILVGDDGPGIPASVRDRIFEPGVSGKAGGWGVGLSLTRRIVERIHGGRIQVRNRRRGGTLFEVELPVIEETPGVEGRRRGAGGSRRLGVRLLGEGPEEEPGDSRLDGGAAAAPGIARGEEA